MNLEQHELPRDPEERQALIERAWRSRVTENEVYIAGPWVPHNGYMWRHGDNMAPLARAKSQEEIVSEDARLIRLGYELTDRDRTVPPEWWIDFENRRNSTIVRQDDE